MICFVYYWGAIPFTNRAIKHIAFARNILMIFISIKQYALQSDKFQYLLLLKCTVSKFAFPLHFSPFSSWVHVYKCNIFPFLYLQVHVGCMLYLFYGKINVIRFYVAKIKLIKFKYHARFVNLWYFHLKLCCRLKSLSLQEFNT